MTDGWTDGTAAARDDDDTDTTRQNRRRQHIRATFGKLENGLKRRRNKNFWSGVQVQVEGLRKNFRCLPLYSTVY